MSWRDNFGWDTEGWRAPGYFNDSAIRNYEHLVDINNELATDQQAQALYYLALYNTDSDIRQYERDYAYQALVQHLQDEYEISFVDEFDWEDFREWYETT